MVVSNIPTFPLVSDASFFMPLFFSSFRSFASPSIEFLHPYIFVDTHGQRSDVPEPCLSLSYSFPPSSIPRPILSLFVYLVLCFVVLCCNVVLCFVVFCWVVFALSCLVWSLAFTFVFDVWLCIWPFVFSLLSLTFRLWPFIFVVAFIFLFIFVVFRFLIL